MNQSDPQETSQPAPKGMRRRDFLISGVKVSLCFAACDALSFRSLGAQPTLNPLNPLKPVVDPALSVNDSLHTIADYLTRYTPPAGDFPADGSWKATYALLDWAHPRKCLNKIFGHATVTRRPAGAGIAYEVDYANIVIDFVTTMKSTMQCTGDRLPALIEWKTDYETHVDTTKMINRIEGFGDPRNMPVAATAPPASLSEQGRRRDGALEFTTKLGTRTVRTDRPVASQWAVLDALRNAKADPADPMAAIEFDLLHDLTSYRPRQRLTPAGVLDIALACGVSQTFHGFVQTGRGTEPTHYWIDSRGRPLIMTEGMIACALTGIEPA
jgi:hypothetical protein